MFFSALQLDSEFEGIVTHVFLIVTGLAVGLVSGFVASFALGLNGGLYGGFASGLALSLTTALADNIAMDFINGSIVGCAGGLLIGASRSLLVGLVVGLAIVATGSFDESSTGLGIWLMVGAMIGYFLGFLRPYYIPVHLLWSWPRFRGSNYRFHPVAWDDACFLPFPGLDRLLVSFTENDPEAGRREIDRLIDEYPSQRQAALRAQAILVARAAADTVNLSQLDDKLAGLPEGEKGCLKETPEVRRRVHEITSLQARLDTLDRPFLREPFAALLVKEIETFKDQIAGFKPPLSTEMRKAARNWLEIARRQHQDAHAAVVREPTHQVFRAGDPVDRDREAFVVRGSLLGELERQAMLSTGCPGLVVYGRRRMGKSTLLRNLGGFLPPRLRVVLVSMQQARAFASLSDFLHLLGQRIAHAVDGAPDPPEDLKGLEHFLGAVQQRLADTDRRLLIGIDEYENLDRKIGEGVLPEDLLAVLRESIQTHRRLIWAFAGSHAVDELTHAPWTSYLVSARTLEVTPFEPEETRLLLTEPLKHSALWRDTEDRRPRFEPGFWGDGGIERVHASTGGWPHLVQLVAENAVDLVNDAGAASVDEALLERALDRAVVRGNNVFLELLEKESHLLGEWDYLRAFQSADEQSEPADDAVARSLRRRRLVDTAGGRWRLRVPLMGRWLRERL